MQIRLMDILADPDNPDIWPLKLKILNSEMRERKKIPVAHKSTGLFCKFYCYRKDSYLVNDPLGENETVLSKEKLDKIVTLKECHSCIQEEVIDGVLYHKEGKKVKWFMISNEIAVMYPLELREAEFEQIFIDKYQVELEEIGITEPFVE